MSLAILNFLSSAIKNYRPIGQTVYDTSGGVVLNAVLGGLAGIHLIICLVLDILRKRDLGLSSKSTGPVSRFCTYVAVSSSI